MKKPSEEHGMRLIAATLRGSLWSRWRAQMAITGSPWWSLKTAWRHRKIKWNDQLVGWEHKS